MTIDKNSMKNYLILFPTLIIIYILQYYRHTSLLAIILIALNLILIIKVRKDMNLLLLTIPIAYANYSIAMGEFIIKNLQLNINTIRTINYQYYSNTLLMLVIFSAIFTVLLKPNINNNIFQTKSNTIIFYGLTGMSLIINFVFFDRSQGEIYTAVRGSSIHGYLYLIILFMCYYSGSKKIRKLVIISVASIISLQSLYFGSRGSLIPIWVVILLTIFSKKINFKKVIIGVVVGIILLSVVGVMRLSSVKNFSFIQFIRTMTENYLVQDTSVFAFNSSITHYFSTEFYSISERFRSLIGFAISTITGERNGLTKYGNVTQLAVQVSFSYGGGILPSHFYFWLGWIGVLISPVIISFIINELNNSKSDYKKLSLVSIAATASTWYIYSPLQFFRNFILFIPLLYFLSKVADKQIKNNIFNKKFYPRLY